MTGALAILRKDFGSYCRSWVGVLGFFAFLLIAGIFFTVFLLSYGQLSLEAAREAYEGIEGLSLTRFVMGSFYLNLGVLFLFLAPLLSMRSLAEEKRVGTLELLYTYPLSDFEIVLGKYAALLAELVLLLLPSFAYLAIIRLFHAHLDGGVVVSGALGFFLLGASFLAVGLFFSSLTENQLLAAGLTFGLLVVVWVLEWFAGLLPRPWGPWFGAVSPFVHFRDFPLGVLDLTATTYFAGTIAFFLFITLRIIEARNWKG